MACLELYDPLQERWEDESLDLLLKSSNGETLVAIAVRVRCIPSYKKLLSRLPENQRTMGCGIAVYAAAQQGDTELVKFLVQEGKANVNFVVEYYHTALSEACRVGPLDIVRYLVEDAQASVDVRTESDDYISAVAFACSGPSTGMLNLVKYLSEEANAVVDPPSVSGLFKSALEIASQRGLLDIVEYLVQEGKADVNRQNRTSFALASAAFAKRFDMVEYLVAEAHADVNLQLQFGLFCTALVAALSVGSRDMVQFLVEEGNANINLQFTCGLKENVGSTLEYAMMYSRESKMGLLEYLFFFTSTILSSGSSANLLIPESHFRITSGSPKTYSMTHESGMNLTTRFCENCGSLLYKTGDREGFEGAVIVLAGTLDNTEEFEKAKPEAEFFVKHRVGWWPGLGFATQLKEFD
ncbi:ankyrin repeat-containing domain protein [Aspergillus minisclerotigenes]|uniref:Ankyrin repeat-containing domain protein n=1 Tax=Aspergillus minisclerotigenes TaxID=656917 RepID=A0A5N6JBZ5_9EURO|nr:ankyrin repeat-containing domain protein [Aspergillus minisclerotigenes]